MIVSHRHRFIFMKTRKTAGTSLEIALSGLCGPQDIITPISPEDEAIRAELGFRGPQNGRIPLTRHTPRQVAGITRRRGRIQFFNHISAVEARRALGTDVWDSYFKFTVERNPFEKAVSRYWWGTRKKDPRPDLEAFLAGVPTNRISDWQIYSIGEEITADFVARHERLVDDLEVISARLGIEVSLPSRRAKSGYRQDHRHFSEILSPAARSRIEETCRREIAAFGYHWDEPERQSNPAYRDAECGDTAQRSPR